MEQVTDLKFWMDGYLIPNLKTVCYNLRNDWDFVFIVSGNGQVRVGKSVLAQQIGYFVAYHMKTPFNIDNIVFSGDELIKKAHQKPKNSVFVYDEARSELDSKKTMERVTQTLLDFFSECGMYNHFIILVLPDFFDLPKSIAINRSRALINVRSSAEIVQGNIVKFKRGTYQFFNFDTKKKLYTVGKRNFNDYNACKCNFFGDFRNFWVVDKDEYDKKKAAFVKRRREERETKVDKNKERFLATLKVLNRFTTHKEIADLLKDYKIYLTRERITQLINENVSKDVENRVNVKM